MADTRPSLRPLGTTVAYLSLGPPVAEPPNVGRSLALNTYVAARQAMASPPRVRRQSRSIVPHFELIDVRVDVREVDIDDLYVTLGAEESAAVEEGRALVLRIEATVIPSGPRLRVFDAPPWDYVVRTPVSREDVEDAIAKALFEVAEEAAGVYRQPVTSDDLKAVASVRVHGELPRAPA